MLRVFLISLDYIITLLFVFNTFLHKSTTNKFYFRYGKYGKQEHKIFLSYLQKKTNINFHTWNQNDKKFKKEIRSVLFHKIKFQKVTKKKKKYHIILKIPPTCTKS